jgi:CheY-like chemotaxis protein
MARVLIVDDEPYIVMVLKELLVDEGYDTVTASDGFAGLEILRQNPKPELLLLDLYMPGLGGREFITTMRSDPELLGIPVILITGAIPNTPDFPPEGSYQEILGKPFDILDVVAVVRRLLKKAG